MGHPAPSSLHPWAATWISIVLLTFSAAHAQSSSPLVFPYNGCSVRQDPGIDSPYFTAAITMPRVDRMCVYFAVKAGQPASSQCGNAYATSLELEINSACASASHVLAMAGGNMLDLTFQRRHVKGVPRPKTVLTVSGKAFTTCLAKGCKVCFYLIGACTTVDSMTRDVKTTSFALIDKSRTCCSILPLNRTKLAETLAGPSSASAPVPPRSLVVNSLTPAVINPDSPSPKGGNHSSPRPRPSPATAPKFSTRNQDLQSYNLILGTQQFSPTYGFTNKSQIVEAADTIVAMGSNLIKMHTDMSKYTGSVLSVNGLNFSSNQVTLKDVFSQQPDMKTVLDMPRLKYYLFWALVKGHEELYRGGFKGFASDKSALQVEYKQMYDAALYLLKRYQGSGKTFFFGNWEGDWMLKNGLDSPAGPAGMIAWVTTRQAAIDNAKKAAKATGVEVYMYLEVNQVQKAVNSTKMACVTNLVLPNVTVDFVSYSAYDSITGSGPPRDVGLKAALTLLQNCLKPKVLTNGINPGTPAPYESRVFVGEYGFATGDRWVGQGTQYTMKQAVENTKKVIQAALEMKSPFVLYWQLYNNEVSKGVPRGWWLITDKGIKTPMYSLHKRFLASAKSYVASYKEMTGSVPSRQLLNEQALTIIKSL